MFPSVLDISGPPDRSDDKEETQIHDLTNSKQDKWLLDSRVPYGPLASTPINASSKRFHPSNAATMQHLQDESSLRNTQETYRSGRTIYKSQQVRRLDQVYQEIQYPEADIIEALAEELGISEAKIKVRYHCAF